MTLTAPLQPEPVICRCSHPYEQHGSALLGCMFGLSQTPDGIKWGCDCPDFQLPNGDIIMRTGTTTDLQELQRIPPDPSCRCGSPLSAHGAAGCTEVVGRDSPDERGRATYCDCAEFKEAK